MGGAGNTVNYGDNIDISAGTGSSRCSLSLQDGLDANLTSLKGVVGLNATTVSVSNDLNVVGSITATNMTRKRLFTFVCSTPVNFSGTTYYRYDVNLNLHTSFTSTFSGSTLASRTRKFKWMSWLTSGAHDQGYDLNYEISYSERYLSPVGLKVCLYGFPYNNVNLDVVNPNIPFLFKNTFDYLTFVCKIQNTSISAIIIDYL